LEKETVGWIGLGNMGQPMSKRLLEAGYPLVVYNRTREKTAEIALRGAKVADSPAALASECEVICTMVADSAALEVVTLGSQGVLATARPGSVLVDMSTVSPAASARVAEAARRRQVEFLRAPVSGSTGMAATGTLGIMVSGDQQVYQQVLPVLRVLGQKVFYLGSGEEARYMKLVHNLMVGATCQILAEALVLGERAGLEVAKMLEVLNNSAVASPLVGYKTRPLIERDFAPAFTVRLLEKDFDIILSVAKEMGVPLPVTALVRQLLASAAARGKGELDICSLFLLAEEMAGIRGGTDIA